MENNIIDDNNIIGQSHNNNNNININDGYMSNNLMNNNDDFILNNNNDVIMNNNNDNNMNNNNNNNNRNNESNKKIVVIISIVVLYISFYDLYQFFQNINAITKAYFSIPSNVFEKCYLYPNLFNSFIQILTSLLGLDLIFLLFLPLLSTALDLEAFLEKYMDSILFFNYLVFGPFCFGSLVISIKHVDKLMYLCINFNPENKIFNYRLLILFIINFILSITMYFIGSFYFESKHFSNSIKIKRSGNNILGYFFWKLAFERSNLLEETRKINNIYLGEDFNNNNNNGKINLDNEGFNQDKKQNLI